METLQILELFGGIGAPRIALKNLGYTVKSIDYVEIDPRCVQSYNAIFRKDLSYKPQSVVGWDLKPSILIHGSPCQDCSVAGHQGKATAQGGRINRGKGADPGSGTRSSLMWETIRIISEMGEWKPSAVLWENVTNVTSKYMRHNFDAYLRAMEQLGYSNSYAVLDARDFGLPQARKRVLTVSLLNSAPFDFSTMQKRPMAHLDNFLEFNTEDCYKVTQPSILNAIGKVGTIRRATVLSDYAMTITTRQDRTPAQVVALDSGEYRYLTEKECWRLQGYRDEDFYAAASACPGIPGKMNRVLYSQAGNSIPIPVLESLFQALLASGKVIPKAAAC